MSERLVTALIAAYNYGRFIEEAIESVLAQNVSPSDMEIIVVDDGSTDDTSQRVRKFGGVRYFYRQNGGQAAALNFGIQQACGEIVSLLDADDVWRPEKLRRVIEEFEEHPGVGMVYHPVQIWDARKDADEAGGDFTAVSGYVPGRLVDVLSYDCPAATGLSFRKRFLEELGPIPTDFRICADSYLGHLIIFVAPVIGLNEPLAKYRVHGKNQYSLNALDEEQAERRWAYAGLAKREVKAWLRRRGYDFRQREIAAYLKRWELWEQVSRFEFQGASRREFFTYLQEQRKLYGPLWTARYRLFKFAVAIAGLVLGYDLSTWLRETYAGTARLARFRRFVFPRYENRRKVA